MQNIRHASTSESLSKTGDGRALEVREVRELVVDEHKPPLVPTLGPELAALFVEPSFSCAWVVRDGRLDLGSCRF